MPTWVANKELLWEGVKHQPGQVIENFNPALTWILAAHEVVRDDEFKGKVLPSPSKTTPPVGVVKGEGKKPEKPEGKGGGSEKKE